MLWTKLLLKIINLKQTIKKKTFWQGAVCEAVPEGFLIILSERHPGSEFDCQTNEHVRLANCMWVWPQGDKVVTNKPLWRQHESRWWIKPRMLPLLTLVSNFGGNRETETLMRCVLVDFPCPCNDRKYICNLYVGRKVQQGSRRGTLQNFSSWLK